MSDLLPCPFCGDPMKHWGYEEVIHANGDGCIIGKNGFFAAAWNTRTPASDGRAEGLREAAGIVAKSCQKCGGEGWLWGHELSDPPDVIGHDDTRYSCDGDLHNCADAILARAAEIEGKADE